MYRLMEEDELEEQSVEKELGNEVEEDEEETEELE